MELKIISLIVFVLTYILFVIFSNNRTLISVISAGIIFIIQMFIIKNIPHSFLWLLTAINWNVMGIFVGTLFVADIFMKSKFPAYIAEIFVNKSKNVASSIIMICLLTGFISAFVENVATVLIVAPIALALAKKLKISPMNMMIAIAVSSNLQGAATLIGDPPSMLLAGFTKMNFFDFFFYKGRPSIFFAIQIGAIASTVVLYFIFKNLKEKAKIVAEEKILSWFPTILLILLIIVLALSSFITSENLNIFFEGIENSKVFSDIVYPNLPGIICIIFGNIALIWEKIAFNKSIRKNIASVDWDTTFFLIAIFIMVYSLTENGWIDSLSVNLSLVIGENILFGYILIILLAVLLSAFIDNVPFLAAMLPVALQMSIKLNINPSLYLFALLIGASLGGNITPIGASANVVTCGILKKEGINVSFPQFMKIGVPFTAAAVISAAIYTWFIWRF
ncbi:MAG: anion permease [Spirochaetes bacterium]|nr:anion permease [Spirochaetota bacterium]